MKRTDGNRALLRAVALGQVLLLVVAGCKSSSDIGSRAVVVHQAQEGKDGDVTVGDPNTIVNGYSALTAATGVGVSPASVTVNSLGDFTADTTSPGTRPALAAGDLVLIIQMAGATIDTADTSAFGTVINLNDAGHYELAGVTAVDAVTNKITLGCSLQKSYTATGKVQVIRVPQYDTLTIDSGASIIAPAWDGAKGGVVALQAATTLQINATGAINVSEAGFHGGDIHAGGDPNTQDVATYRSALAAGKEGGEKGEGIAGWPNHDPNAAFPFPYGRGAPANAGGGGNWHNAGGGGGANAAASGLTWTGEGVMWSTAQGVVGGTAAWLLDPGDIANGGLTTSSGGGRGGYTYSNAALNPTVGAGAPGQTGWNGNDRRERGGLGGHPLTSSPAGLLFMGGGGGAGDENNTHVIQGGRGGGLAFVIAGNVQGTGKIQANGAVGGPASGTGSGDAPGGGGGGGTVVIHTAALSGISVEAIGGPGGSQTISNVNEAEGPGGGGGGGYIALSGVKPDGGTLVSALVTGGSGGTTNAGPMVNFPSNGATRGQDGLIENGAASSMFYCTDPMTTITPTNVATGAFTVSSSQSGVTIECKLDTGAYGPCLANYTVGDGDHTIYARATDINGNVGPTVTYAWHAGDLDGGVDAEAEEAGTEAGAADAPLSLDVPPVLLDAGTTGLDSGEGLDGIVLLDAGEDTSPEDGAVVSLDAATSPADGPLVLLDAAGPKTDVAVAIDAHVPPVSLDASEDGADGLGPEDAMGDGNELEGSAQDAQVVVAVEPSSSDASQIVDQAPSPKLDAAGTTAADAAAPGPDAGVPNVKAMGGGFCTVNPMHDSAPGLFTFFLLAAFGLLVVRRRRR
jgi:MYXO-CTERM domain-containing protein